MADKTELRDFIETDYPGLCDLWTATGIGNPARGDSLESIERSLGVGARLLVIEEGGLLLGSVWLTDDARRLYVHHMAVLPERQGRGLGASLLEAAIEVAAEKGLQMKLEVHHDNLRAIALYRRLGFDFIGDYEVMLRREIAGAKNRGETAS